MDDKANRKSETIEKPSGLVGWCFTLLLTPIFFVLGLSVTDGFPDARDTKSWTALLLFSSYPIAAQFFELFSWHARKYFQQPVWWTGKLENQVGQAFLIAILWGAVWAWPDTSTLKWLGKSAGNILLLVIPAFVLVISIDWILNQLGKTIFQKRGQ